MATTSKMAPVLPRSVKLDDPGDAGAEEVGKRAAAEQLGLRREALEPRALGELQAQVVVELHDGAVRDRLQQGTQDLRGVDRHPPSPIRLDPRHSRHPP
jgi:hypothetical protein